MVRKFKNANELLNKKTLNEDINQYKNTNKEEDKDRHAWTEKEWRDHMEIIGRLAEPKKEHTPEPIKREKYPIADLLQSIDRLSEPVSRSIMSETEDSISHKFGPSLNMQRICELAKPKKFSTDSVIKDNNTIKKSALKYVPNDRILGLSEPKQKKPCTLELQYISIGERNKVSKNALKCVPKRRTTELAKPKLDYSLQKNILMMKKKKSQKGGKADDDTSSESSDED